MGSWIAHKLHSRFFAIEACQGSFQQASGETSSTTDNELPDRQRKTEWRQIRWSYLDILASHFFSISKKAFLFPTYKKLFYLQSIF